MSNQPDEADKTKINNITVKSDQEVNARLKDMVSKKAKK